MASSASDRDVRYTLLVSVLENATGIFSRLLGVVCEDREGLYIYIANSSPIQLIADIPSTNKLDITKMVHKKGVEVINEQIEKNNIG